MSSDGNSLQPLFEEPPSAPRRVRAASVTLRDSTASDEAAALMDPATKSLADALKITFRLLQLSMVALVVLFAISGSQSVYTGERAIRLVFGKPVDVDLSDGFQWSLPPPLGELVKMPASSSALALESEFWPSLMDHERTQTPEQLAGTGQDHLNPERDGSVITADGFLAHTQWVVTYRRENPEKVHRTLNREDEARIVKAAVRRGVVHAAAQLTLDELLKGVDDASRAPQVIARRVAERMLAELDCGIEINELTMTQRMPPRLVARDYNLPAQAQSEARSRVDAAGEERSRILTGVAGRAAGVLISQIDLYEQQLELGQTEEAAQTLARIDAILLGEETEINGELTRIQVDGEVPTLLARARQERSTIAAQAQTEANNFLAIRESYSANPQVVLTREWTDSVQTFLKRDNVHVMLQPSFGARVLLLNRDPAIAREMEQNFLLRRNQELERERNRMRMEERLRRRVDPTIQRLQGG